MDSDKGIFSALAVPVNASDTLLETVFITSKGIFITPLDGVQAADKTVIEALEGVFVKVGMVSETLGMDGPESESSLDNFTQIGLFSVFTESFSSSLTDVASRWFLSLIVVILFTL